MKSLTLLCTALVFSCASAYAEKNLFDGKTLKGWDGDPKFWSVKDGAIVGQTTKENPTKGNTFIICKDLKMKDFDLHLDFKIEGGNSGIQYRSVVKPGKHDGWRIGGYQADFESGGNGFQPRVTEMTPVIAQIFDPRRKIPNRSLEFRESRLRSCFPNCRNSQP